MRRNLVDVQGRDADPRRLAHLSGYLEADPVQEGSGIALGVGLSNDGDEKLVLLNPFEMTQFLVCDEKGFPLAIPRRTPRLLTPNPTAELWVRDSPVPVREVRRDGQPVDAGLIDTAALTLEPNEEWLVRFELDRLANDPGSSNPGSPGGTGSPVPNGIYKIRNTLTLIDADYRRASRILQGDEIEVRFVRRPRPTPPAIRV